MTATLDTVTDALHRIAPLEYAEEWDSVGLLIEPTRPEPIDRLLLAIDLTQEVLEEAIHRKARMIVAYHPPIFQPLQHMAASRPFSRTQRIVIGAIEAGIAVYSPHTALDAVVGGVNDWLCDGLGPSERLPIRQASIQPRSEQVKINVFVPHDHADHMRNALTEAGAGLIGDYSHCSFNLEGTGTFLGGEGTHPTIGEAGNLERVHEIRMEMVCSRSNLPEVAAAIHRHHPYEEPAWEVNELQPKPVRGVGQGRWVRLNRRVTLTTLVRRVKEHLNLDHVRVAAPSDVRRGREKIEEVAVCAGAGGSVFRDTLHPAYLTGEMRHHDVLAKVAQGSAVLLTDHTNTERGYLPTLKEKLRDQLGGAVKIDISKKDAEPLRIM